MNEEFIEEDVLEDSTSDEDNLSSDQGDTLNDKLDRIEALLNEDIALREASSDQFETVSGNETVETVSGNGTVSGNDAPDYSQYIYDLLTDSSIKVEVVEEQTIFDKQLNDYTVGEALGVCGISLGFICIIVAFVDKYTFKRR